MVATPMFQRQCNLASEDVVLSHGWVSVSILVSVVKLAG